MWKRWRGVDVRSVAVTDELESAVIAGAGVVGAPDDAGAAVGGAATSLTVTVATAAFVT